MPEAAAQLGQKWPVPSKLRPHASQVEGPACRTPREGPSRPRFGTVFAGGEEGELWARLAATGSSKPERLEMDISD